MPSFEFNEGDPIQNEVIKNLVQDIDGNYVLDPSKRLLSFRNYPTIGGSSPGVAAFKLESTSNSLFGRKFETFLGHPSGDDPLVSNPPSSASCIFGDQHPLKILITEEDMLSDIITLIDVPAINLTVHFLSSTIIFRAISSTGASLNLTIFIPDPISVGDELDFSTRVDQDSSGITYISLSVNHYDKSTDTTNNHFSQRTYTSSNQYLSPMILGFPNDLPLSYGEGYLLSDPSTAQGLIGVVLDDFDIYNSYYNHRVIQHYSDYRDSPEVFATYIKHPSSPTQDEYSTEFTMTQVTDITLLEGEIEWAGFRYPEGYRYFQVDLSDAELLFRREHSTGITTWNDTGGDQDTSVEVYADASIDSSTGIPDMSESLDKQQMPGISFHGNTATIPPIKQGTSILSATYHKTPNAPVNAYMLNNDHLPAEYTLDTATGLQNEESILHIKQVIRNHNYQSTVSPKIEDFYFRIDDDTPESTEVLIDLTRRNILENDLEENYPSHGYNSYTTKSLHYHTEWIDNNSSPTLSYFQTGRMAGVSFDSDSSHKILSNSDYLTYVINQDYTWRFTTSFLFRSLPSFGKRYPIFAKNNFTSNNFTLYLDDGGHLQLVAVTPASLSPITSFSLTPGVIYEITIEMEKINPTFGVPERTFRVIAKDKISATYTHDFFVYNSFPVFPSMNNEPLVIGNTETPDSTYEPIDAVMHDELVMTTTNPVGGRRWIINGQQNSSLEYLINENPNTIFDYTHLHNSPTPPGGAGTFDIIGTKITDCANPTPHDTNNSKARLTYYLGHLQNSDYIRFDAKVAPFDIPNLSYRVNHLNKYSPFFREKLETVDVILRFTKKDSTIETFTYTLSPTDPSYPDTISDVDFITQIDELYTVAIDISPRIYSPGFPSVFRFEELRLEIGQNRPRRDPIIITN